MLAILETGLHTSCLLVTHTHRYSIKWLGKQKQLRTIPALIPFSERVQFYTAFAFCVTK